MLQVFPISFTILCWSKEFEMTFCYFGGQRRHCPYDTPDFREIQSKILGLLMIILSSLMWIAKLCEICCETGSVFIRVEILGRAVALPYNACQVKDKNESRSHEEHEERGS